MSKLFFSYAHLDSESVVNVVNELRNAGHTVWIDTDGIRGGAQWVEEITKAIIDCDIFILFISSKSILSDHVRRELDLAFEETKKILPLRLEKVEIPVRWRYQLAGIQYIDFQTPHWESRMLIALGGGSGPQPAKYETGKLKNPFSSRPVLEPIERRLVLSNREDELNKAVQYMEDHRLLLLTGMPGIGKSTVACALLDFRPVDSPDAFWYDFERQKSSGNTLGVLLDRISGYLDVVLNAEVRKEVMAFRDSSENASVNDVDKLIAFLSSDTPIWLVFDNLETVLSRDTKEFLDEGLDVLFESLKNNNHNAKIIITNPYVPVLKSGELLQEIGTQPLVLNGFDDVDSLAFLRAFGLQGISEDKLEPLVHEINGHPFVLNYIAHYIQAVGVSAALENLAGGLEEVSERFGVALKQRLSSQEFEALQSLTILNREMTIAGLCQIAQVRTNVITRLREKGLLQANDTGKFWLHGIVRNSMKPTEPSILKQAHLRAVEFYRRQPIAVLHRSIDDYADVLEWHHHAVEADDVISAYAALDSTGLTDQLLDWNEYELLVKLCERTLTAGYRVEADLSQVQANLSNIERIKIQHTLGNAYFLLGDYPESIMHFASALQLLQSENDDELRIRLMIFLSESYNANQDYAAAMRLCGQLEDLLPRVGNELLQAKFLHLRGIINRDSKHAEAAVKDLEEALQLYEKLNKPINLGNVRIDLGNVHYYQNLFADAIRDYERALASFESQGDRRGMIIARFNVADIMLQSGQFQRALVEIGPAIEIARKSKFVELELRAGLLLVETQISLSLLDEAEYELNMLRPPIVKRGSSCLSGQELVLRAYKLSKQNQAEQALDCFVQALELLKNPGCQYEYARGSLLFGGFMKELGQLKRAQESLVRARNIFNQIGNQLSLQATQNLLDTLPG